GISLIENKPDFKKVATTGMYSDLVDVPSLINVADTASMLLPYVTFPKISAILDEKASNLGLVSEIERAISAEMAISNELSTETNRALTAEAVLTTDLATEISRATTVEALKEDSANKSTDGTLAENSDIRFPTE